MGNLSQGNLFVTAYFTKCKQLWDEYVILVAPFSCESRGSDVKLMERQQLMQFWMGLNDSYQMVRSNLLMLNPLPTVSCASSMVLQEEQQKEIRNDVAPHQIEMGSTAFLSHQKPQPLCKNLEYYLSSSTCTSRVTVSTLLLIIL